MYNCSVYFILAEPSYNIKIGISDKVPERLKALQTSNPERLSVLGTQDFESRVSATTKEKRLHALFGDMRIGNTEWFRLDSKLISYLKHNNLAGRLPAPRSIKPPESVEGTIARDIQTAKSLLKLISKGDEVDQETYLNVIDNARRFNKFDQDRTFHIGCADYRTRHVLYLVWLAAQSLCTGVDGNHSALFFLEQAASELKIETLLGELCG